MSEVITIHGFADSNCPTRGITRMHFGYHANRDNGEGKKELICLNKGMVTPKVLAELNLLGPIAKSEASSESEEPVMGTNNMAEYYSMLMLHAHIFQWATENNVDTKNIKLYLYTDSRLMFHQVTDKWRCRNENLIPLYRRMQDIQKAGLPYELHWIERENNELANQLAADEVDRFAFCRSEMKENIYNSAKHGQIAGTGGATAFPAYSFLHSYLFTDMPKLRNELDVELSDIADIDTEALHRILTQMQQATVSIQQRILIPKEGVEEVLNEAGNTIIKVSHNSRRKIDSGVEKHKAAGQMASDAVKLLGSDQGAVFNGAFISLITSYRKAERAITPEMLVELAQTSIASNAKDPQFWIRNLSRLYNPFNAEHILGAVKQLEEAVRFFFELLEQGDYAGLRDEVQHFFATIFSDRLSGLELLSEETDTEETPVVEGFSIEVIPEVTA